MRKFRAFISYSHADEAAATALHKRLETYRPPRVPDWEPLLRLSPVFRDRDELATSSDLGARIEEALSASQNLIVLCSPRAASSQWVNQEIRAFAAQHGVERIHPVIVDGTPPACFPPALLEANPEPLAADIRSDKDGFEDGALKLIAGVLGAPFGVLKDREAKRARRRLRLAGAAALVFAGLTAAAVYAAFVAVQETNRAEAQLVRAEAAIAAAVSGVEGVVEGIAENTSEGMMRNEAAVDLLSAAGAVAEDVTDIAPENAALRMSSAALKVEFAETYAETGLVDLGERFAAEALDLLRSSHADGAAALQTRALIATASAALRRGENDLADERLIEALDVASKSGLVDYEALIFGRRAEVARAAGDLDQAAELAGREFDLHKEMLDLSDLDRTSRYVEALLRQEMISVERGLPQTGVAAATFAENLSAKLVEAGVSKVEYLRLRSRALARLAKIRRREGDLAAAGDLVSEAVVVGRTILRDDPRSLPKMEALIASLSSAAEIYAALGRGSDQRIALTQAVTLSQEMTIADPVNVVYAETYAEREFAISDLLFAIGESEEASRRQDAAVDVYRRLAADTPNDEDATVKMLEVGLRRGAAHRRLGEYGDAISIYKEAAFAASWLLKKADLDRAIIQTYADLLAAAAHTWRDYDDGYLAIKFYNDAIQYYRKAKAGSGENLDLTVREADALIGVGRALVIQGEDEQARRALGEALDLLSPLHNSAPENALLTRAYAEASIEYGRVYLRLDDPDADAKKKRLEATDYLSPDDPDADVKVKSLTATNHIGGANFKLKSVQRQAPRNLEIQALLGLSQWADGDLLRFQRANSEAFDQYAIALRTYEKLVSADPTRAIWVERAGILTMKLGQMRRDGRLERYRAARDLLLPIEIRATLTPEAKSAMRFLNRRIKELASE